jgi:hypothetical protein
MTADSSSGYVVVMTVPPSLGVNLVVGESLNEFLSLGCRSHFACLAGLVEDITAELESESDIQQVADVMAALRGRFSLSPWPNVAARLSELEARYGRPEGRVPRDREAEAELVRRSREFVEKMKRSATASSRAESERLGLIAESAHACDACLATEAFRQRRPDGLEEDAPWPFLLSNPQEG